MYHSTQQHTATHHYGMISVRILCVVLSTALPQMAKATNSVMATSSTGMGQPSVSVVGREGIPAPVEHPLKLTTLTVRANVPSLDCFPLALGGACRARFVPLVGQKFSPTAPFRSGNADDVIEVAASDSDRRARKRDFDAKGTIPCAQEQGQPMGECGAAVARGSGGDVTVVVTFPNGFARRLFFQDGMFVSANATMSGSGTDTDWQLKDGVHVIRVDDQRYDVPHVLVFGD